ncbi:TPA: hypothetical protein N0F65_006250 [Lagenidium giganteum]|uniref:phospholipase A2 n=1 Tax=Lagenidium giganteum TaxID=4803 RepID=A0AAV2Z6H9_9STRA|nr:TPA: hypothetical protein N0F65_006250 [Lagenidium giganteum]
MAIATERNAELARGDVVRFCRGQYSHVGIYMGNGRVIHLWSPTTADFRVRIDLLRAMPMMTTTATRASTGASTSAGLGVSSEPENFTARMDARMLVDHDVVPLAVDDILYRAQSRLGATDYDALSYNCEHFVTWARYGVGTSPQVRSNASQVLAGALVGAAVGGMTGFVVGGLLSLFTKMDALTTSTGAVSTGSPFLMGDDDVSNPVTRDTDDEMESDDDHGNNDNNNGSSNSNGSERRRAKRERLWEDLAATTSQTEDNWQQYLDSSTSMADKIRATSRPSREYSDARHEALAARLAEENLQCGICYYNLGRVKAVAFACDHFTCARCYQALKGPDHTVKCCPYCRLDISTVHNIHSSTKIEAKGIMDAQRSAVYL